MTFKKLIRLPFRAIYVLGVLTWAYASAAIEHIRYGLKKDES